MSLVYIGIVMTNMYICSAQFGVFVDNNYEQCMVTGVRLPTSHPPLLLLLSFLNIVRYLNVFCRLVLLQSHCNSACI